MFRDFVHGLWEAALEGYLDLLDREIKVGLPRLLRPPVACTLHKSCCNGWPAGAGACLPAEWWGPGEGLPAVCPAPLGGVMRSLAGRAAWAERDSWDGCFDFT